MKRTREAGLRPRLLALVLVPIVLLAALTWTMVGTRQDQADAARRVQGQIDDIASLVELTRQLLLARTPVEIEVRAKEIGLPQKQALELLGVDGADFGDLRTLAATLRIVPLAVRPFPADEVAELARQVDAGPTAAELARFDDLQDRLEADWQRQVQELRSEIVELGDADLGQIADDLSASSDAGSATAYLIMGLSDHWFSSLADPAGADRGRLRLAAPAERFEDSIALLEESPDRAVAKAATTVAQLRANGTFGTAIDDALAGRDPAPFVGGHVDLEAVATTFADAFAEFAPLLDLLEGRTEALAAEADRVADEAARSAEVTAIAMGTLIVALLLLSLAVTASFLRPLRRLIDAMRAVGGGDLSGDRLPAGGPPEVNAASAAFNDVLANLRLLEGKVEALARGDLDDPRLGHPLPGALGVELDDSVAVLAGSIAERFQLQERLEHQATHDSLTGIANRAGALAALDAATARAHRHGTTLAVAFIDLDRFKAVNDRHGHAAGDAVLVEVAARLASQARAGDACARMGGDEFIVIAEHVGTRRDAEKMGARLAEAIGREFAVPDGSTVRVGVSVGIALSDAPNESPGSLLHRADLAAYEAKRSGSTVRVAPGGMGQRTR